MILLVHLLFGAAVASKIQNPVFAIILAFLSHYFLDFIPHTEYNIENIKKKQWSKALPDILKITLDFIFGILLILLFLNRQPIIFIAAFFAILPDGLTVFNYFFPNKILNFHSNIHRKKIHFFRDKKISNFWRITSQILMVIISIVVLKV